MDKTNKEASSDILAAENLPTVTMTEEVAPVVTEIEAQSKVEADVKPVPEQKVEAQSELKTPDEPEETVSLDDFNKVKEGLFPTLEKPVIKELPKSRDFTGLAEDEKIMFKQMSNEAYAKLYPAYLERKQLQAEVAKLKAQPTKAAPIIPDSYLEHEKAITLTPEYEEAAQKVQLATDIVQHWENQLANIRRGKDWQTLVVDQKTGTISVDPTPKKADAQSEAAVNRYLTLTANQQFRVQEQFNQFVGSFKSRRDAAVSFISEQEKKYFGAFDDEKHPARQLIDEVKNKLPAEFRSSPLAPMLAKSLVACLYLEKKVNELQSNQQKRTIVAGDVRKAGPTMSSINGSASGKDDADVSFDDFLKVKQGDF